MNTQEAKPLQNVNSVLSLYEKYIDLHNEYNSKCTELEASYTKISNLADENVRNEIKLKSLHQKVTQRENQILDTEVIICETNLELSKVMKEKEKLNISCLNKKNSSMEAEEKQLKLQQEMDILKSKNISINKTLAEKTHIIHNLECDKIKLNDLLKCALQNFTTKEKEYKEKIYTLEEKNKSKTKKLIQATVKIDEAKSSHDKLQAKSVTEGTTLKVQLAVLRFSVTDGESKLLTCKEHLLKEEKKRCELEELSKKNTAKIKSLKNELKELNKDVETTILDLKKSTTKLRELEIKIKVIEEKNSILNEQNKKLNNYISVLNNKNVELEAEIEEKEKELKEAKIKAIDKKHRIKEKLLESKLNDALKREDELKKELVLSEEKSIKVEKKNCQVSVMQRTLEQSVAAMTGKTAILEAELHTNKCDLAKKNDEVLLLKRQLNILTTQQEQDRAASKEIISRLEIKLNATLTSEENLKSNFKLSVVRLKTLEEEKFNLKGNLQALKSSITDLKNNFTIYLQDIQKVLEKSKEQLAKLAAKNESNQLLQNSFAPVEEQGKNDLNVCNKQNTKLEEEVEKCVIKKHEHEQYFTCVTNKIINLDITLKDKEKIINGSSNFISKLTVEKQKLEDQIKNSLVEKESLKNDLEIVLENKRPEKLLEEQCTRKEENESEVRNKNDTTVNTYYNELCDAMSKISELDATIYKNKQELEKIRVLLQTKNLAYENLLKDNEKSNVTIQNLLLELQKLTKNRIAPHEEKFGQASNTSNVTYANTYFEFKTSQGNYYSNNFKSQPPLGQNNYAIKTDKRQLNTGNSPLQSTESHHSYDYLNAYQPNAEEQSNNTHICRICGYVFLNYPSLVDHLKRYHGKYPRRE